MPDMANVKTVEDANDSIVERAMSNEELDGKSMDADAMKLAGSSTWLRRNHPSPQC